MSDQINIIINIIYPQKLNKMDNDKLLTAQRLANKIEKIETALQRWSTSTGFATEHIFVQTVFTPTIAVSTDLMDFETIKAISIGMLTKSLTEAKKEFEAL